MASACVNNIGDNFTTSFPSYGWLSPRISISRDDDDDDSSPKSKSVKPKPSSPEKSADPDDMSVNDFEFRLEDPVSMLPADELFSNGKLMPLQLSSIFLPPESPKSCRSNDISGIMDPYLFSPKAPRCSSRWKELLGLKRLYHKQQGDDSNMHIQHKSLFPSSNNNNNNVNVSCSNKKSLRNFLHTSSKSHDSSLSLPLLKENNELNSLSSSSTLSLSSSSSGLDEIDLSKLSLDTEKSSSSSQLQKNSMNLSHNPPRIRLVKSNNRDNNNNKMLRCRESINNNNNNNSSCSNSQCNNLGNVATTGRGLSVDSPRMNSSGKIVFHSLERSSSSPSSFNGGVRYKHRGMERSYSAHVRVTPLLNVPVCSSLKSGGVFGFPFFSAPPHKRNGGAGGGGGGDGGGGGGGGGASTHKSQQQMSSKRKSDRV